jgi:hypothetical protein
LYDISRGSNHEELSIKEQLRIAIDTSSLMPGNSASVLYWEAGILPDLRFGGNCIDQAGVFMDFCPYLTQLLTGSDRDYPHYAVGVDEGFFDPYWGQQHIQKSGGNASSHAQIYTIRPKWMDGYWRVGYRYSPYYLKNGRSKDPTIYVEHFRPFNGDIGDAQLYLASRLNRNNPRFEFRYIGDDGLSDVILNYYFKKGDFDISIRNIEVEGKCGNSELDIRASEIQQLYGITLTELQEYFEVAADLGNLRR